MGRELESFLSDLSATQGSMARRCRDELANHQCRIGRSCNARLFNEKLAEKVARHEAHLSRQFFGALRELGWARRHQEPETTK
jgi:hypothetical protein